ncbi:hypothetical protein E4U25_006166 [Claviceps purpurea]|nr:hypothetical protein E4U25_006166 [Claviceps purpurea]
MLQAEAHSIWVELAKICSVKRCRGRHFRRFDFDVDVGLWRFHEGPPMCATDFLRFQFEEYLDIPRQEDAIFVHCLQLLQDLLERDFDMIENENCVFLARDVQILFELEPQEISAHMGGLRNRNLGARGE